MNCVDQFDLESVEQVWAWDGGAWELLDDGGPPANVVTGMGWDDDRDVLVRYGGIPLPSQECSPETWEWDTSEWRLVDAEAPEPCDHIELAFDASAGEMLLVGGGQARDLSSGTWAWDGNAWSQLTDEGPAPRAHHGFVYDGSHEQAFLYGGYDGLAVFDDLWSWDGSAWEELTIPGDGPGPSLASRTGRESGWPAAVRRGDRDIDVRLARRRDLVPDRWPLVAAGRPGPVDPRHARARLRPRSRRLRPVRRIHARWEPAIGHLGVGWRLELRRRLLMGPV